MLKTMYRVGGPKIIVKVSVLRFNDKNVWLMENGEQVRRTRYNQMYKYHALFSEAKESARQDLTTKLVRSMRDVELYESQLDKLNTLEL